MNVFKMGLLMAVLGTAAVLQAENEPRKGLYVSGTGSLDFASNRNNLGQQLRNGGGAVIGLGYFLSGPVRVETELGYETHENERYFPPNILALPGYLGEDGGKSSRWFLMANAIYDFSLNDRFDYYVGAGVGGMRFNGRVRALYPVVKDYDNIVKFGAQFLTGLVYHLTDHCALSLGYRLSGAENASYRGERINTGAFHSLEMGIRFTL